MGFTHIESLDGPNYIGPQRYPGNHLVSGRMSSPRGVQRFDIRLLGNVVLLTLTPRKWETFATEFKLEQGRPR